MRLREDAGRLLSSAGAMRGRLPKDDAGGGARDGDNVVGIREPLRYVFVFSFVVKMFASVDWLSWLGSACDIF